VADIAATEKCGVSLYPRDNSEDWSDAIKPLGEGDCDPKDFLRALKRHQFKGPIILHTFGLMKKPNSRYKSPFEAEVDSEKP
jgi:hypothetical protein